MRLTKKELENRTIEMAKYMTDHDKSKEETVAHFKEIGKYNISDSTLWEDLNNRLDKNSELYRKVKKTLKRHDPKKEKHGLERAKIVIKLHDVDKWSFANIGKVLNISKATAIQDYHKYHSQVEKPNMATSSETIVSIINQSNNILNSEDELKEASRRYGIDEVELKEIVSELKDDFELILRDKEDCNKKRK